MIQRSTSSALCPDCMLYTLKSMNELENNRCEQCSKRYRSCTTLRTSRGLEPIEYVPIKDCGFEMYEKFLDKFNEDKKFPKTELATKNNKEEVTKSKRKSRTVYTEDFINYVRLISEGKTTDVILELIHKNKPDYANMTINQLIDFLANHGINYTKRRGGPVKKVENITEVSTEKTTKKYTDDVIEKIRELAGLGLSAKDMADSLNIIFRPKTFNPDTLYQVMYKHRIKINRDKQQVTQNVSSEELNTIEDKIEENNETVEISTRVQDPNMTLVNQEDRYKPIKEEVEATAKKRFKKLNCDLDINPTTQDYINALKSIKYLCSNLDKIQRNRINQHDIMSNYADDVIHTIENEETLPGDTYLQDKLKVLRNLRRYYEYDKQDMIILEDFIKSVNIKKLDIAISKLETESKNRSTAIYIPTVDLDMVEKYEWAVSGNQNGNKLNKPVLKTIQATTTYSSQSRTFRASCQISGGGYGAFTHWFKDYRCNTQTEALANAKKELANIIRQNRGGVHYINLTAHQIN